MNFKERMQLFVDGIIRSTENESLMKAKLIVAAESKNKIGNDHKIQIFKIIFL